MSTVCSVLIGSGRKPIMFENQMKKKSVARKGNHCWPAVSSWMLPPVMLLRVRS